MFALFTLSIYKRSDCRTTGQIGYRTKKRTKDQRYVGTKERRNERRNKGTFDITIILVYQRLPDIYNPTTLSPK